MKVGDNRVVELVYELVVDGQLADHMTKEKPLAYIHGNHCLLEKFEELVTGLEPGDPFAFTLAPADAYGEVDPERIISLPKEMFMGADGKPMEEFLQIGAIVPLVGRAGNPVPGRVIEVSDAAVKLDINSPMAGKTLNFSGEIISVREATEKELKEGLYGEYVKTNCGGGCGGGCHHGEGGCHHGEGGHEGGCCHHGEGEHEGGCCHHGDGEHEGGCCHH